MRTAENNILRIFFLQGVVYAVLMRCLQTIMQYAKGGILHLKLHLKLYFSEKHDKMKVWSLMHSCSE